MHKQQISLHGADLSRNDVKSWLGGDLVYLAQWSSYMLPVREQLRWFGSIPVRVHLSF